MCWRRRKPPTPCRSRSQARSERHAHKKAAASVGARKRERSSSSRRESSCVSRACSARPSACRHTQGSPPRIARARVPNSPRSAKQPLSRNRGRQTGQRGGGGPRRRRSWQSRLAGPVVPCCRPSFFAGRRGSLYVEAPDVSETPDRRAGRRGFGGAAGEFYESVSVRFACAPFFAWCGLCALLVCACVGFAFIGVRSLAPVLVRARGLLGRKGLLAV